MTTELLEILFRPIREALQKGQAAVRVGLLPDLAAGSRGAQDLAPMVVGIGLTRAPSTSRSPTT
ncbi:hypothetical protein ACIHEI_06260 [Kitasatospora sp. NPDC051984]|uniref:hypothetical protein n=1 Tax=Kitasatospora sp. NPDC051984 TaxID=3364059 RepID=UPI0037CCADF2